MVPNRAVRDELFEIFFKSIKGIFWFTRDYFIFFNKKFFSWNCWLSRILIDTNGREHALWLSYGVLDYCARYNEEIQIIDALMTLTKEGKVIVYKFQGARFDCGSAKGLANFLLL